MTPRLILELPTSGAVAVIVFLDVKVFNAFAESSLSSTPAATFQRREGEKRKTYEEHMRKVERGSFTPLVFSSSRGMGKAAIITYQRLTSLLSDKWKSSFSVIMGWLNYSLGFSLLCSSLMCLWIPIKFCSPGVPATVDLIAAEGHLAKIMSELPNAGLMIMASHRTFSSQNKHVSGQIKFGQTNLPYIINGNFIEFVNNECPDKFWFLS